MARVQWTKAGELQALDDFIKMMGPNSYLGPWLAENYLQIARDIANDVCIEVLMPNAAMKQAEKIVEDAKEYAKGFRESLEADQASRRKATDIYIQQTRETLRRDVYEASRKLERVAEGL